jgi:hypothetical protein
MNALRSATALLGAATFVTIFSACSGGISTQPGSTSQAMLGGEQLLHPLTNPARVLAPLEGRSSASRAGRSWISPNAKTTSLLYVGNSGSNSLNAYSYPSWSPVGVLLGFNDPYAMCVDAAQDVYVPNFNGGSLVEYAHGALTPIRSLSDHQGEPISCAIDPTTGNLAVANYLGPTSTPGSVIVFAGAKGTPIKYTAPNFARYFFVAYSSVGNLFLDGVDSGSIVRLAELPKGKSTFVTIATNQTIGFPGGVAWDGEFLAVGDQLTNTIYQFKVSGVHATAQGATTLNGADDVFQFSPTGGTTKHPQATAVVGADFGAEAADQWQYPAGGTPVNTVTGLDGPEGVAISK